MKLVCIALVAALAGAPTLAALPPLSPAHLHQQSSHVVVGEVRAVYSYDSGSGEHVDTRYVAEIAVDKVDKGGDVKPGTVLYARYWHARQRPHGWAGPSGQAHLPLVGNVVRIYLRRSPSGAFDILEPNGIEPVAVYG